MATVIHREKSGEREFRVPIEPGVFPDWPFTDGGELVLRFDAGELPSALSLRLYPTPFEYNARLPKLVAGTPLAERAFELAEAGRRTRPVVVYEAPFEVVMGVKAGLKSLEELEAYLLASPELFDLGAYRFAAIEFEDGLTV